MRNICLLAVLTIFIASSCKKETLEVTDNQSSISTDDYTVCYGSNSWENDVSALGDRPDVKVVYNNKVYIFHTTSGISNHPLLNKIAVYDGTSWQLISSDVPFDPQYIGFSFVIGNKAYFGYSQYVGGSSHGNTWQYNFITNNWATTEDFPDYYLDAPAYFTVGNKGYVVGGYKNGTSFNSNRTWEFDPAASPKWRARANIPGVGRIGACGFSIGDKGYIVNGKTSLNPYDDFYYKGLLQYNPSTNTWSTKTSFPGVARYFSKGFVIEGCAYVGEGFNNGNRFRDMYKYDPVDNDWVQIPDYSANGEMKLAFALNNKGYALWRPYYPEPYRLKKYNPRICTTIGNGGVIIP
jgi:hypothetical protein